ncbi:MAG: hypothetical protein K8I65_12820, partial [Thermoanaerobaculia bacterium]|nr:hypothetical protein [Thermoanaerobaculia bacterium]
RRRRRFRFGKSGWSSSEARGQLTPWPAAGGRLGGWQRRAGRVATTHAMLARRARRLGRG